MSYLNPESHENDQWPDHPQRFETIAQFRDSAINLGNRGLSQNNNGISFAGVGPRAFKIERVPLEIIVGVTLDPNEPSDTIGWQYCDMSNPSEPEGLTGPKFETVKALVRWLWYAKAKDILAAQECERCGVEHTDENAVRLHRVMTEDMAPDDSHLCASCVSDGYSVMHSSRAITRFNVETERTNRYWIHNAIMDNDYMSDCDDCMDTFPQYGLEEISGSDICESCRDDHYRYAEDTGRYIHSDYAYYSDSSDCWYEDSDSMPRRSNILQYNANVLHEVGNVCYLKNKSVHLRNAGDALIFGVELETDTRSGYHVNDLANAVQEIGFEEFGICKEDSTVSGIEMVTLPCDLESHLTHLKWSDWMEALRPMAKGHYGADNGIHIHIARAALPKLVLGKMLVFMNNRNHTRFLETIAQRPLGSWCPQSTQDKIKSIGRAGNDPFLGKYAILNTTSETVECRMFNSTLLHERMFKNLEFLHALVNWTSQESAKVISKGDDCSNRLVDYIDNASTDYPHLHQFISNRLEA